MNNSVHLIKVRNALPEIAKLIHDVKIGKLERSFDITSSGLILFKRIISHLNWKCADELMNIIREQGRILSSALPHEAVIANLTRRILKLIREEYDILQTKVSSIDDSQASLSLHKLVTQTSETNSRDYSMPHPALKKTLIDHLQEIENELETSSENISVQAEEHIHSSEVILTLGHSKSVENFLQRAAEKRQCLTIIIAECAPECRGYKLAKNLAIGQSNLEIVVISDSSIYALMSRVNKVIIGTQSILANGGLRAPCGAYTVALAAKHYSVPVIVLAPMYKLSPVYLCSFEQNTFNLFESSEDIVTYGSLSSQYTTTYSPSFDYVPPELVTLFISNIGGHAPSYVYRLLSELYHPEDYQL